MDCSKMVSTSTVTVSQYLFIYYFELLRFNQFRYENICGVTGGSDKLFTNAVHTPPSSKRLMKQGSDDIASYLRDDGCFYRELPCRSRLQLIYGASSVVSAPTRIFIVLQRAITLRANTNIRWNTCGLRSRRSVSSTIRATLAPPPPIPVLFSE